jgi:hypothetical protein
LQGGRMNKPKPKKKSPLEDPPLRYPGQGLDEEINRIYDDQISINLLYIVFFIAFILYAWIRFFFPISKNPIGFTILGILTILYFSFRLQKAIRLIKNLKLGRDGERIVGQGLEELRAQGFGMLHDVMGHGFNLDHVIFSKHGIYVVETKTFSKPLKGKAEITFQGPKLMANGQEIIGDPIIQAKAEADWLKRILEKTTAKKYPVKGVVVFPGWFVQPMPSTVKEEAWVLNPKALSSFISNEPIRLKDEEVAMAVFHLSRFVRVWNH